ncbi:hypothetical protein JW707_04350 [Candidatus Woesearchaeota archaeon]|nr:hypothetical protein [Candidatus Woesearchaeota archaeon]
MKKALFVVIVLLILAGCGSKQSTVVPNGGPAETQENGDADETPKISLNDAIMIAMDSECTEEGILGADASYNSYTDTWWIDLELEKEGCNPACVVDANTEEAEINWRCTGLIPE